VILFCHCESLPGDSRVLKSQYLLPICQDNCPMTHSKFGFRRGDGLACSRDRDELICILPLGVAFNSAIKQQLIWDGQHVNRHMRKRPFRTETLQREGRALFERRSCFGPGGTVCRLLNDLPLRGKQPDGLLGQRDLRVLLGPGGRILGPADAPYPAAVRLADPPHKMRGDGDSGKRLRGAWHAS
jgi:hypothetical protein